MNKINIYGQTNKSFYKVAQDSLVDVWDFKNQLDGTKEVDFVENGSNYKLENDEIFFINTTNDDLGDYLNVMINTNQVNSITKNALKVITTLYVFEGSEGNFQLYIQRIMPAARAEKTILSFKPDINLGHIEKNKVTIPILNYTHIYWNQERQKIYFKKFADLEIVFPNFAKYYREANENDLEALQNTQKYPFLSVKSSILESLPKTKLKTIAMIVDELDKVKENIDEYKQYAQKYKPNFIVNDKFEINVSNDIDNLADIVFRKIYTTEAGEEEIRIANSFRLLKSKCDEQQHNPIHHK